MCSSKIWHTWSGTLASIHRRWASIQSIGSNDSIKIPLKNDPKSQVCILLNHTHKHKFLVFSHQVEPEDWASNKIKREQQFKAISSVCRRRWCDYFGMHQSILNLKINLVPWNSRTTDESKLLVRPVHIYIIYYKYIYLCVCKMSFERWALQ